MQDYIKPTSELNIKYNKQNYNYKEDELYPIKGFVQIKTFERGKKISNFELKNVFTTTGKEWLTQLMSYSSYAPLTGARNDRIRYIGLGSGTKPQTPNVDSLATPISYDGTNFLAQLNIATYPNTPSKTSVLYSRTFDVNELSVMGSVNITEAGLFTDGGSPTYAPGTRNLTLAAAGSQSPLAYWTTDQITKTQDYILEISWTLTIG